MILNRTFYNKTFFLKSLWNSWQMRKLTGPKVHRFFELHRTELPGKMFFYSPRLKRKPHFSGDVQLLRSWQNSKLCETMCPTNAIKVTDDDIIIDGFGCITCGLCLEISPPGLLEMSSEFSSVRT